MDEMDKMNEIAYEICQDRNFFKFIKDFCMTGLSSAVHDDYAWFVAEDAPRGGPGRQKGQGYNIKLSKDGLKFKQSEKQLYAYIKRKGFRNNDKTRGLKAINGPVKGYNEFNARIVELFIQFMEWFKGDNQDVYINPSSPYMKSLYENLISKSKAHEQQQQEQQQEQRQQQQQQRQQQRQEQQQQQQQQRQQQRQEQQQQQQRQELRQEELRQQEYKRARAASDRAASGRAKEAWQREEMAQRSRGARRGAPLVGNASSERLLAICKEDLRLVDVDLDLRDHQLAQCKDQLTHCKDQLTHCNAQLAQSMTSRQSAGTEFTDELIKTRDSCTKMLADKDADYNEELVAKDAEYNKELAAKEARVVELEDKLQLCRDAKQNINAGKASASNKTVNDLKTRLDLSRSELKKAQNKCKKEFDDFKQNLRMQHVAEIQQIKTQQVHVIDVLKRAHEGVITELNLNITELNFTIKNCEDSVKELEQSSSQLDETQDELLKLKIRSNDELKQKLELTCKLDNYTGKLNKLFLDIDQKFVDLAEGKSDMLQKVTIIRETNREVPGIKSALEQSKRDHNSLRVKVTELETAKADALDRLKGANNECLLAKQELEAKLLKLKTDMQTLKDGLRASEAEREKCEKQIERTRLKYQADGDIVTRKEEEYKAGLAKKEEEYRDELDRKEEEYQAQLDEKELGHVTHLAQQENRYKAGLAKKNEECLTKLAQQETKYEARLAKKDEECLTKLAGKDEECKAQLDEKERGNVTHLAQQETKYEARLAKKDEECLTKLVGKESKYKAGLAKKDEECKAGLAKKDEECKDEMAEKEEEYKAGFAEKESKCKAGLAKKEEEYKAGLAEKERECQTHLADLEKCNAGKDLLRDALENAMAAIEKLNAETYGTRLRYQAESDIEKDEIRSLQDALDKANEEVEELKTALEHLHVQRTA
jgi:hypothetical protein